ncbi:MAG: short chain dehydrogenase [Anaerolineaceae bacterium]|nr:MAG: short chain dehydrogenase [Anaerolineaceae bacterium]
MNDLSGKTILITGAARRLGRSFALACARAGADIIIHHGHSPDEADSLREEIASLGRRAWVLASDFSNPEGISQFIEQANELSPLYGLVNSASIFESLSVHDTTLDDWNRHLKINLTAPFLLSQAFANQLNAQAAVPGDVKGRIVNILDWRALRPGADHFPYTITKSALAAMTKSMAIAFAPNITVNGLALGAILPPADHSSAGESIIEAVPAKRWSEAGEAEEALLFLLSGPAYITGEIIHLDGGRHLI